MVHNFSNAQCLYSFHSRLKLRDLLTDRKLQGPHAGDAMAEPYLVLKNLVSWKQQITWFSVTTESRNNHRYAVVVQDLATQWIQACPCRSKISQETQRSLQKFLEPDRKPNVIDTDNSLEFGKACEDLSWNHCTSTSHRSETNGIVECSAQSKRRHFCLYCCNRVSMKVGGQILWNVIPICETSQVYNLMGKTLHERRFGQPFEGPVIPFGSPCWVSPYKLRKISPESINLERKFYLDCSSDTLCTRSEFGKVTYWSQTLRSWRRWTHRKSTQKDSMGKRWYFPKKENLFFQKQMDESKPLEDIRTWEHPPWYGIDQFKERVILTFLENQKGPFLHNLMTHFRMPVKR